MEDEIAVLLESLKTANISEFRQGIEDGIKTLCSYKQKSLKSFGSRLLDLFVQLNWTGPKQVKDDPLPTLSDTLKKEWDSDCLKDTFDGESWYELSISPHLLSLASCILVDNMVAMEYTSLLWALRCLSVQQQLLNVRSSSLWNKIQDIIDELVKVIPNEQLKSDELCCVHLEISNCLLDHSQYDHSLEHLKIAEQHSGISLELSGALGRRTKFQEHSIAQLQLKINKPGDTPPSNGTLLDTPPGNEGSSETPPTIESLLPRDVLLDDDTLLNRVQFNESERTVDLIPTQQAYILNSGTHYQRTSPVHRLTTERLEVYLQTLLSQPKCWIIQAMSLYMRCRFDRSNSRKLERSMIQLQELVDGYSKPSPEGSQRMKLFYCVPLPPCWLVEKDFADTLVSLGSVQGALEVYERLHLWDDTIACYQMLKRHGQAERVIRERIAKEGETVKLLCLLGDAAKDYTCYERAWELSNCKSARAQKSLGLYYLHKDMFKECSECLLKSVTINPLQHPLWFTLGHAADRCGDHTLSAHAYRQCVTLDTENFEGWNNLAGQYIKLKDKTRAFNAFQEALKCNYENWKIWENYLTVAVDVGEFEEAIRAYHRLLDIRKKHLDTEVLAYLVEAVTGDMVMRNGNQASTLRDKISELLARVVAQTTGSSELWEVCSILHLSSDKDIDISKGLIELQKAQRSSRQAPGWEDNEQQRMRVHTLTLRYSQACRKHGTNSSQKDVLSSARLSVQAVITKLKKAVEFEIGENRTKFDSMIDSLSDELRQLSA